MRRSARRKRARTAKPVPRAKPRPAPPATVLVQPDLLRTVAGAVASAGELETGGPLIGTVQSSWDADALAPRLIVSVLATVPPAPALRAGESWVSLGRRADGERAASAIRWWRAVTGLELVHLGDWHKHDARMPEPSDGDRMTAKKMSAEARAPIWLTAIAVGQRSEQEKTGVDGNCAQIARSVADCEQLRFYRAAAGAGLTQIPIRVEAEALPALPQLPWHVTDPARFAAECRLLAAYGYTVAIEASKSRARLGLVLRLRSDEQPGFTVFTAPGYPLEPPLLRDGNGRRVKPNGLWSPGRFLVDLASEVC
jgi:hypothetical protein